MAFLRYWRGGFGVAATVRRRAPLLAVTLLVVTSACSPTVNGGWLVLHQQVVSCPTPEPTP